LAEYVIGDVQGCHDELVLLLAAIAFDRSRDRLWLVGDLVNRGPRSLEAMRLVKTLGDSAEMVLGNHDLHLLAAAAGTRAPRKKDTLDAVLSAPDRIDLIEWLRHRPMAIHDPQRRLLMVHAGLAPQWDTAEAVSLARELEVVLRGPRCGQFLDRMYGDEPQRWDPRLEGQERLRFITNALTRVRYVTSDGRLDLRDKGPPGSQRQGLVPWFAHQERRSHDSTVIFGHWATLQIEHPVDTSHGVIPVDTGCVWGGPLTARRLGDGAQFQVPGLLRSDDAPGRGR
jgi:bis(5'-nucleosyl)-tetraphosphatase (symmetrical)